MRRDLSALSTGEFDLLVVGGGICGAAAAWDAAQRGLSVALVERGDFSGATSAESLKVVHGGIRYLQHLDLPRVRESSRERSALLRIAPHLVHPFPFVVPAYGHGMRGPEALAAAFLAWAVLTTDRNRGIPDPDRRVPRGRIVSRREVLDWFPQLEQKDLTGAGMFWDGQMYNPPRLVWSFVRSALRAGAVAANHCEVTGLVRRGGRVCGATVKDRLDGGEFEIRSRVVLNATGPFAESLLLQAGIRSGPDVPFSRDMAVVIRRPPGTDRALALQTRYRDPDALLSRGFRHIFLVPWHGITLIGVNSAIFRGDPNQLRVSEAEVQGFLDEINEAAPQLKLSIADVSLVMAGLLPIAKGELVGEDVSFGKRPLVVDNARFEGVEGLITAIANRYTTARGVAERAIDLALRKLGRGAAPCRTTETPLYGGDFPQFDALVREVATEAPRGLPPGAAERLAHNYGTTYVEVLRIVRQLPGWGEPIADTGILRAEVIHAVRHEMAFRLGDCVFRRTDLCTAGNPGDEALRISADLAAGELGWTAAQTEAELRDVRARFPFPTQ
jgi:glycerol-3-phosphate dehydrogenase